MGKIGKITPGEGVSPFHFPEDEPEPLRVERIEKAKPNPKHRPDTVEISEEARKLLERSHQPEEADDTNEHLE